MSAASPQAEPTQAESPEIDTPRTVLLTRSAAQGAAFARALTEECAQNRLGECRVLFASLQQARTVKPGAEHAAALEALASGHYAWVSFTSANTVRSCAELWGEDFARAVHAGGVRVACVGAATARAVRAQLGLDADFQPSVQSAAGMLAEFERPATEPVSTEPAAVLVLEGSNARPTLREGLKNLGWDSHRCVLYDMVPAEQVAPGELSLSTARALVQGNAVDATNPETPAPEITAPETSAPDALVVTAPSRLHALLDGTPALTPESVPPVVAIGASTASACRALNLRYVQADSPSPQDLARAAASLM